jgi:hypothetical protein
MNNGKRNLRNGCLLTSVAQIKNDKTVCRTELQIQTYNFHSSMRKFTLYYSSYTQNNFALLAIEIIRFSSSWISKTEFCYKWNSFFSTETDIQYVRGILIRTLWANWCLLHWHDRSPDVQCFFWQLLGRQCLCMKHSLQYSRAARSKFEILLTVIAPTAWLGISNTANNSPVNIKTVVIWLMTPWRLSFDCIYQRFKRT